MRRRRWRDDGGESLVELLVALTILATAVAVLLAGLSTAILMSDVHRKQAAAGAYVRAFAEAVSGTVAAYPSGYVTCATTGSYASAYTLSDPNFTASVVEVRHWNGSTFSTCGTDSGVQRVTVRVASTDGKVEETLSVILRRPCRNKDDFPQDWPCP